MRQYLLKLLVLTLTLLSFSNVAFAQNENTSTSNISSQVKAKKSKYFERYNTVMLNMVSGGDHSLQLGTRYLGAEYQVSFNDVSTPSSVYATGGNTSGGLQYIYGVNDNINVGADLIYTSGSSEMITMTSTTEKSQTSTTKGLSDLNLRIATAFQFDSAGLHTALIYNPKIGTPSSNEDTHESNAYHEQPSIQLKTTLVLRTSDIKYGADAAYNNYLEGSEESITSGVTTTRTVTGGNSYNLGAFVEFESLYNLNLRAAYGASESKTYTNNQTKSAYTNDSPAAASVGAAMKFDIDKTLAVLPSGEYMTFLDKTKNGMTYEKINVYALSLALRKVF